MRWRSQALLGILGMVTAMSGFWSEAWGLPPGAERGRVGREVVRILLSEVQVAEMKLERVRLEVVRFFGEKTRGPAVLLGGEGIRKTAGREDRVSLEGDSASAFPGQWRKLSSGGEVLQVPVRAVVQGEAIAGALVVWQRQGRSEGRFVSDEAVGDARNPMLAQGLAAPQPNLPTSEYIVDFYADPYFTEWVGSFIRLCNGATLREGIQIGFSKTEEATSCQGPGLSQVCFAQFVTPSGEPTFPPSPPPPYCQDLNQDGDVNDPGECAEQAWIQVDCPCSKRPGDTQCLSCGTWCGQPGTPYCPWWCLY